MLFFGFSSDSARSNEVLSTLEGSSFLRRYHMRSAGVYTRCCDHLEKGMSMCTDVLPESAAITSLLLQMVCFFF